MSDLKRLYLTEDGNGNKTHYHADAVDVVIDALRDSLRKLSNEAAGFLAMADRQAHGNTNIAVLQMRINDARALLETLEAL